MSAENPYEPSKHAAPAAARAGIAPGVRSSAAFIVLLIAGPILFILALALHEKFGKAAAGMTGLAAGDLEAIPLYFSLLGLPLIPVALVFWQLALHRTCQALGLRRYSRRLVVLGALVPGLNLVIPFRQYLDFRRGAYAALATVSFEHSLVSRLPLAVAWWGVSVSGPVSLVMAFVLGVAGLDSMVIALLLICLLSFLLCYVLTLVVLADSFWLFQTLARAIARDQTGLLKKKSAPP